MTPQHGGPRSDRGRPRRFALAVGGAALLLASGCLYHPQDDVNDGAVAARTAINDLLDQADVAEGLGDLPAAQALRAQAADDECASFGCDAPLGSATITIDPALSGGFFSAPWPSDTRLDVDGSLDLTGFPGRATSALADTVLGRGEASTFGFGTNSGIFFQPTAALEQTSIPILAEASMGRRSNAMLIDLDHPGAPNVPILADSKPAGTDLRPANLLSLVPYPGHPLSPSTRYAAVLFDGVHDLAGDRLAPSPVIDQLDGAAPGGVDPADWAQLQQDRVDTIAAVRARTLWHPSELVAFTAFTTQDTTGEMQAVADAVADLPTPQVLSRTPFPSACTPGTIVRTSGRLALPIWQQGTRPYADSGGGIVVGVDGKAVQQGVEMGSDNQGVLLDMAIPCGPAPVGGWPILLWINGTGGTARATPISQLGSNIPYAVLSIAPLYSGDRLVASPPPLNTSEFQFYNYLNPLAGRTNLVQQAADEIYLERLARAMVLAPTEAGGGVTGFDDSTLVMAGHSQGSSSLPLTLAVDDDHSVTGAFLSAGGAGLYHSIVHRNDVRPLVDVVVGAQTGELDMFHPYPQVLQTFAEVGDAANYAAAVETDIALYAGLRDGCSAIEVSIHLAEALGVPIVNQLQRRPLFGAPIPAGVAGYTSPFEPASITAPVSANLAGGRTGVMVEVDAGHFGASNYPAIGRSFIDSIATGGPVVVTPGATPPVAPGTTSCVRYDPVPLP